MGTLQDALNLIGEVHDALAFNNVGGGRGKLRDAARILRELIDKDAALEAETGGGETAYEPCGGCGNADPDKRCLGCLHPFVATTTDERAVEALPAAVALGRKAVRGATIASETQGLIRDPLQNYVTIEDALAALAQGESRNG